MYFSVLLMISISTISAQKNIIEKSEDQIKMFNAQQRFFAGDFQGALNGYNELLKSMPNNSNMLLHKAECFFGMNQFEQSLEYAKKNSFVDLIYLSMDFNYILMPFEVWNSLFD